MVLQEQALGPGGMQNDLVNALPELRICLRLEHDTDSAIARLPRPSAIIGAVDATRRNRDIHPP